MTGKIPESFFGLTNLLVLGIDDNLLESPVVEFAKFKNIQKLYAEGKNFDRMQRLGLLFWFMRGVIFPVFWSKRNLIFFFFKINTIKNGLKHGIKKDNMISGEITEEMIRDGWQSMVDMDFSVNRLVGPLPSNIWSIETLEVVDLHGNDLVGQIPEIEAVHDKLFFFAVQDNSLVWKIPETISNLVNLRHLDVSANQLAIPFPSTMSKLTALTALYTGINGFEEHRVPDFLASMTNLKELSMKQNNLTGEIPSFLGDLTNLKVLDLDFNLLNGTIPTVSET